MRARDFYDAGLRISYLRYLKHFSTQAQNVKNALIKLQEFLKSEGIAKYTLNDLPKWISKFEKDYPGEEDPAKEKDRLSIRGAVDKWRDEIGEELENIHVLRIELQTGLNPVELEKVAEKLDNEIITSETWKKLTEIEKSDFSDAAKCLLLGTATPSVMVALRGAEASIRNYYRSKTRFDPAEKTWRQLTKELKTKIAGAGEDTFIGYLDYFGDAKRNFAQHPNKIYSLREAGLIFMQVIGLVEDIYSRI